MNNGTYLLTCRLFIHTCKYPHSVSVLQSKTPHQITNKLPIIDRRNTNFTKQFGVCIMSPLFYLAPSATYTINFCENSKTLWCRKVYILWIREYGWRHTFITATLWRRWVVTKHQADITKRNVLVGILWSFSGLLRLSLQEYAFRPVRWWTIISWEGEGALATEAVHRFWHHCADNIFYPTNIRFNSHCETLFKPYAF